MLAQPLSPVPSINIEFCTESVPVKEPSSPFDNITFMQDSCDVYRSNYLVLPPSHSPKERVISQPIRTLGKGLDAARFEALRAAARSNTAATAKQDLRKEVAVRAHHSKQLERRKLFLSKIEALPSPTAASLPVTPPESPAVFHFTLPSPGLVSPLALFETLEDKPDARLVRVEQVDFRARARKEAQALAAVTGNLRQSLQVHGLAPASPQPQPAKSKTQALPSLDQISKRLGGNVTITRSASPPTSRLPAFLQKPAAAIAVAASAPAEADPVVILAPTPKHTFVPTNSHGPIERPRTSTGAKSSRPPTRPTAVALPGPRIASTRAPTPLTADALTALANRAECGSVMMERLQRRFSAPARMAQSMQPQRSLARPVGGF